MREKKLERYGSFDKDPVIRAGLVFAFIWSSLTVIGIGWFYRSLPPVIPLFYSVARGQQQLAQKPFLAIFPIVSVVFFVTHLIFTWSSYSQDMVFARIMTLSASLVTFMLAIASWHILWIVL